MRKSFIIGMFILSGFVTGCTTTSVPQNQKSSYRGSGEIISIILTEKNYQEVSIQTKSGDHVVVLVKEPKELFPGQKVQVNRMSNGFGTVDPK